MDEMDSVAIVDVTAEVLGERREEWRAGFDAGLREGVRRVLQSNSLEQLLVELAVLRAAADILTKQVDYWQRKSDENELAAEDWHGVAARVDEALPKLPH